MVERLPQKTLTVRGRITVQADLQCDWFRLSCLVISNPVNLEASLYRDPSPYSECFLRKPFYYPWDWSTRGDVVVKMLLVIVIFK